MAPQLLSSPAPSPVMNTYACLRHQRHALGDYAVLPVQPAHIEPIRQWRNAQMDVLRQAAPISPEQQVRYFAQHIWPTQAQPQPANVLLAYLHRGALIGYGGLVHIAWEHRRAELSFLLEPSRTRSAAGYADDFGAFLRLMQQLAFDDLGFRRLFTETYAMRTQHIAVLEAKGFALEGRLRGHVLIDGQPVDSLMHGCLSSSPHVAALLPPVAPEGAAAHPWGAQSLGAARRD